MRTTIRMEPSLLAAAKSAAIESGRTLTAVIEDAVREALGRKQKKASSKRMVLPTFKGKGLRAGVDLDDSAHLRELMDEP